MVDQALAMSPAASVVSEDKGELRRGPWAAEEDVLLVNYVAKHGEGRWNSLARSAGLKRTGKSCRLRWLNYLRPDVRRGDITPAEQLLILELHARWGNRWSEIARRLLPGRTDNEVKNYWRTRVQRHAKRLRCDVSSRRFQDVVRQVWVPRLVQRVQAESSSAATVGCRGGHNVAAPEATSVMSAAAACQLMIGAYSHPHYQQLDCCYTEPSQTTATTAGAMSPDDASSPPWSSLTTEASTNQGGDVVQCSGATTGPVDGDDVAQEEEDVFGGSWSELLATTGPDDGAMIGMRDFELGDFEDNLWSLEDIF